MRTTKRTGDTPENNWCEVGPSIANSVEVSLTAKGTAQVSMKLFYETPENLEHQAAEDVVRVLTMMRKRLAEIGIPLAGEK